MSEAEIKKNLHIAIEEINDEAFLQAVYTIVSSKVEESKEYELTPEQLRILEDRRAKHLSGESKSYTWDEVKERIRNRR